MKRLALALAGLLAFTGAVPACPPAAGLVGGAAALYGAPLRQRSVVYQQAAVCPTVVQAAPVVVQQSPVVVQAAPVVYQVQAAPVVVQQQVVADPCPVQVQQLAAPVYQQQQFAPSFVPMQYADPGVSFAPAPVYGYSHAAVAFSTSRSFAVVDPGYSVGAVAVRQRVFLAAPVAPVLRTRTVTRTRTLIR